MACNFDPNDHLSWDVLGPYILPYVLGVPDELMNHHARLACIDFCKSSGILHDENYIDLQKGEREYFLTTECDYQIIRTYSVTMLNRWTLQPTMDKPIRPYLAPFNTVGYYGVGWWGGPYGYYMYDVSTIIISPATQQDFLKGLRVEFIVAPTQDSCTLNNYLYSSFAEEIAAGAISTLKLIMGQNWSDPKGSGFWQNKFRRGVAKARATADRNFTSGPLMMRSNRWV